FLRLPFQVAGPSPRVAAPPPERPCDLQGKLPLLRVPYLSDVANGGFCTYGRITLASAQSGVQRATLINNHLCQGKLYTFLRRRRARTIRRAASSGSKSQGMRKSFTSVIGVRTKPGQRVVTAMPLRRK